LHAYAIFLKELGKIVMHLTRFIEIRVFEQVLFYNDIILIRHVLDDFAYSYAVSTQICVEKALRLGRPLA